MMGGGPAGPACIVRVCGPTFCGGGIGLSEAACDLANPLFGVCGWELLLICGVGTCGRGAVFC